MEEEKEEAELIVENEQSEFPGNRFNRHPAAAQMDRLLIPLSREGDASRLGAV